MKRYILLSYDGNTATAAAISALGEVLKVNGVTTEQVHGICMDEAEVCSILAKTTSAQAPVELSIVESSCIYAQRRFGKFFGQGLKLTLAVSEDVISHPHDAALVQAIKTLAKGVSTKMRTQYGLTNEDILVFKYISKDLPDV